MKRFLTVISLLLLAALCVGSLCSCEFDFSNLGNDIMNGDDTGTQETLKSAIESTLQLKNITVDTSVELYQTDAEGQKSGESKTDCKALLSNENDVTLAKADFRNGSGVNIGTYYVENDRVYMDFNGTKTYTAVTDDLLLAITGLEYANMMDYTAITGFASEALAAGMFRMTFQAKENDTELKKIILMTVFGIDSDDANAWQVNAEVNTVVNPLDLCITEFTVKATAVKADGSDTKVYHMDVSMVLSDKGKTTVPALVNKDEYVEATEN